MSDELRGPCIPNGTLFYDKASGREMLLVSDDEQQESWRGWICYRHPDGQWVSLRKATDADRRAIRVADSALRAPGGGEN